MEKAGKCIYIYNSCLVYVHAYISTRNLCTYYLRQHTDLIIVRLLIVIKSVDLINDYIKLYKLIQTFLKLVKNVARNQIMKSTYLNPCWSQTHGRNI
jgi:hypothetical protein